MNNIAIIVAISTNNVIGNKDTIPWRLPRDMKFFKDTTVGNTVIMGRKTYESFPEKNRPLPNRINIVLSKNDAIVRDKWVMYVNTFQEALEKADLTEANRFLIGGVSIYEEGLRVADTLYITRVHATVEGNIHFPEWNTDDFSLDGSEYHEADEKNEFSMTFEVWHRKRK